MVHIYIGHLQRVDTTAIYDVYFVVCTLTHTHTHSQVSQICGEWLLESVRIICFDINLSSNKYLFKKKHIIFYSRQTAYTITNNQTKYESEAHVDMYMLVPIRPSRWWTARCLTPHNWKYARALIAYDLYCVDDAVHVFNSWVCSACIHQHIYRHTHLCWCMRTSRSCSVGTFFGWDYKGQPPKKPLIVSARLVCMNVYVSVVSMRARPTYKRIPRWPCPWRVPMLHVQKFHHQPEWHSDKIKKQNAQHKMWSHTDWLWFILIELTSS